MNLLARLHPQRLAAAGWLRLLFIIVLAADLVGAPLHPHHHEAGADGAVLSTGAGHLTTSVQPHLEDDGEQSLFHATTSLRVEAQAVVADEPGVGPLAMDALLPALVESMRPAREEPAGMLAARDARPPPRLVHLSRPPEGRAPPGRA